LGRWGGTGIENLPSPSRGGKTIKLYNFARSPYSQKVRVVLAEKRVPYDNVEYKSRWKRSKITNPASCDVGRALLISVATSVTQLYSIKPFTYYKSLRSPLRCQQDPPGKAAEEKGPNATYDIRRTGSHMLEKPARSRVGGNTGNTHPGHGEKGLGC